MISKMKQTLQARRFFENPVFKDKLTILKSSEETGGVYSFHELEVAPGGGNMLHVHKGFTETFTAVKGVLGVRFNNRKLYLQPGQSVSVPVGTPHHFFNDTGSPVVCNIKFEPGHSGFEKGLAIVYGLAADGKTSAKGFPKSFVHLALIVNLTDTRPTGVLGLLTPVFNWLAKRARKKGTEQQLLRKYYYQ
jgi:mannose-6-phosphate isomerase-like protein (cupin superfamily)